MFPQHSEISQATARFILILGSVNFGRIVPQESAARISHKNSALHREMGFTTLEWRTAAAG